jgi:hypothetical protein
MLLRLHLALFLRNLIADLILIQIEKAPPHAEGSRPVCQLQFCLICKYCLRLFCSDDRLAEVFMTLQRPLVDNL